MNTPNPTSAPNRLPQRPEPKQETAPENNSFMAVMRRKELTQSKLTELSRKLAEVAYAASQTGKKGSLTLKIDVVPDKGALHFEATVKQTIPTAPDHLCLFYIDPETMELTRKDPNQEEFDLRTVHSAPGTEEQPAASAKTA